ncbi:MAG: hypothetical protein AAGJ18_17015 [Bacteroidota bacterium]
MNHTILIFFSLFISIIVSAQSVTTLQQNFPANGFVSVSPDNSILVSNYGTWNGIQGDGINIFKLNPEGVIIDTLTGFKSPMGTAVDSQGNLFVNNDNNMRRGQVLKVTPEGEQTTIATIEGWPSGMNIDEADNLYIPNYTVGILHKITPTGEVSVVAKDSVLLGCTGVDFDSKGNIILSNFMNAKIFSVTPNGKVRQITQIPNITIQQFGIGYLTVVNDTIYATAIAKNKIYAVTLAGEISELIGTGERSSIDGDQSTASFNGPNGIRASNDGQFLYISEYGGSRQLRKISIK